MDGQETKTNGLARMGASTAVWWSQRSRWGSEPLLRALYAWNSIEDKKIQRGRRDSGEKTRLRFGDGDGTKARSRSRQPPPIDATHDRFALLRLLAGGNEEPGGRPGNECAPALGVPCSGHHHCCIKSGDCGM